MSESNVQFLRSNRARKISPQISNVVKRILWRDLTLRNIDETFGFEMRQAVKSVESANQLTPSNKKGTLECMWHNSGSLISGCRRHGNGEDAPLCDAPKKRPDSLMVNRANTSILCLFSALITPFMVQQPVLSFVGFDHALCQDNHNCWYRATGSSPNRERCSNHLLWYLTRFIL